MSAISFTWSWQGTTRDTTVEVSVPSTVGENAPLVVLLHGTGGDANDMTFPALHPGFNVQRVAEGTIVDRGWHALPPVGWWSVGGDDNVDVVGWEPFLHRRGVPTINYRQAAAKGSLAESAAELRRLLEVFEAQRTGEPRPAFAGTSHRRIVLMGHSRGGVLARQVLADLYKARAAVLSRISTCITLHAPNQGSNIANVGIEVDRAASGWQAIIDQQPIDGFWKLRMREPLDRFLGFVRDEMAVFPDYAVGSPVLAALAAAEPVPGIKYFTFGGTRSWLFNLRAWEYTPDSFFPQLNNPAFRWRTAYRRIMPVPPPLPPGGPLPEMTDGRGDACVAAAATRLPFSVHRDNNINHAEALWHPTLQGQVAAILDGLAPAASIGTLELPVEFGSFSVTDRLIRHRNYLGEITPREGPPEDFLFSVVRKGDGVALRSVNFPAAFLRHRDFRIRLEAPPAGGDALFEKDTTFQLERGLADPGNLHSVSFRSVNIPDHYLRQRNFSLYLEPKSSPNLAVDATFSTVAVPMQLRSFNIRDRFIRHRNYLGELTPKDASAADFLFTLLPRGEGRVTLRSVNFPDLCLRHRDFRIRLEGPSGTDDSVFAKDTTFHLERGLADPNHPQSVSLRSENFPDRYLRHRNFELYLEPKGSPNLGADATFYVVPVPMPAGSETTVPQVVGLRHAEADERIRAAQLQARSTGPVDPVATVGAQMPAGDTKVKVGSAVSLTPAIAQRTVPHVVGVPRLEAEQRVRAAELQPQFTGSSDSAATVSTQSPVGDTKVNLGSAVSLTLAVAQSTVPNVIGLGRSDAESRVTSAGLRASVTGSADPAAAVSSQTPAGGATVARGSTVSLELAAAPKATVPDVVGWGRLAAEQAIVEAGLVVSIGTRGDWVSDQAPAGGETVAPGSPVQIDLYVGEPF